MGTIMEMRRLTEEIEKEKRHLLKPSWTKDSRDQEDLEDLRGYNTKLGEADLELGAANYAIEQVAEQLSTLDAANQKPRCAPLPNALLFS